MGFSNHPKKKTPRLSGKKNRAVFGFFVQRGGLLVLSTHFRVHAWKCMKTWETSKFPAEVRKRSEATWEKKQPEKTWRFSSPVLVFEVWRGYDFFCCFHLWENNAWPVWDVHILVSHVYIYIYMIYNDYTCPNRIGERFTLSRESYVRSILGNAIIIVDSSSKCCKSSEIK